MEFSHICPDSAGSMTLPHTGSRRVSSNPQSMGHDHDNSEVCLLTGDAVTP